MNKSMSMNETHWSGARGEHAAQALRTTTTVKDEEVIDQLGLEEGDHIRVTPVVRPPERPYDGDNPGAYGGSIEIEVSVIASDHKVKGSARSGVLKRVADGEGREVAVPWPINEAEGNVFADRTGNPYAVRPHVTPRSGVHFDEIELTPAQTPQTGSGAEREMGLLPRSGTRSARMVLRCEAPGTAGRERPEEMEELTMQLWPHCPPGRGKVEPWTIRGYDRIEARIEEGQRNRDTDETRGRDAGLMVGNSPAKEDLEEIWREIGWGERPAGDGMLSKRDIRAMAVRMMRAESPAKTRGIRSFSRQRIVTALDTARRAIQRGVEANIERVVGKSAADGSPIPEGERMVRIDPETGTEGDEHAQAIAQRLAEACAQEGGVNRIENEMRAWRQASRAVRIPHGCSRAERDSIRKTILQTAHRMSRHPDDVVTPTDLTPAPMAGLFVDLTSTSHNTRPGKAASTHGGSAVVSNAQGQRIPAVWAEEIGTGEVKAVTLEALEGECIEVRTSQGNVRMGTESPTHDNGRAARWRILDASALDSDMLREMPLSSMADATRVAMANSMGEAALGNTAGLSEPLVRALDGNARLSEATLPTQRMLVAAYDGDPSLFEDGVMISKSAAEKLRMRLPQEINLQRHRAGETGRIYVGAEAANFEEARANLAEQGIDLTREAFDKIDIEGLVKPGVTIEPSEIVQLYCTRTQDPATGEMVERYGADRAPSHGRRLVVSALTEPNRDQREESAGGVSPQEMAESEGNGSLDDDASWEPGELAVRIRTIEETEVDSGFKVTSLSATKGMVTIRNDEDMPCTEEGRAVDIAISGYSMMARMSPADMIEMRLGHLVQTRTQAIERGLEEVAGGRAAAWTEALARYARTLTGETPGGERTTLIEAIGMDAGPIGPARAERALAQLRALGTEITGESKIGITVPHAPARDDIEALTRALDYAEDEECVVTYANAHERQRGRRIEAAAMAGVCGVMMLRNLGRKSERLAPLGRAEDGVHPLTGQRRDSRRLGVMESDAQRASGSNAHDEMRALADARARRRTAEKLAQGLPVQPREADGPQQIEETIDHWTKCLGMRNADTGSANREWVPENDSERRSTSAGEVTEEALETSYDREGNAIEGGLADGPEAGPLRTRHIELPISIVHPLALERGPGEGEPVIATLLGVTRRELVSLAAKDNAGEGGNGPDRIRRELRKIERAVATDPERVKRSAEQMCPDDPERFVEIVETMQRNPGYQPSNWVQRTVAVADPRMRVARRANAMEGGGTPHQTDSDIREILRATRSARRHPEQRRNTTEISRRVNRYLERVERLLFGKKGLMNRAAESPRVGVSASGAILPGDPSKLGSTHVEVSPRAALALCEHIAVPAFAESEGMSERNARRVLSTISPQKLSDGDPLTTRAWETLRRAAAVNAVVVTRSPALHAHSSWAMEMQVRDAREQASLRPGEDTTVALPPAMCEGMNADFDGDQVALYGLVSESASADARRHANPGRHMTRLGDGAAQGVPKQAARAGVLHALAKEATPAATLKRWMGEDATATALIERARRATNGEERARWGERRAGQGVRGEDIERLIERMKPKNAVEEGALGRIVGKLWEQGFAGCEAAPINLNLGAFEAFADVWNAVKRSAKTGHAPLKKAPVPANTAPGATKHVRDAHAKASARRFEAVEESIKAWVRDPEMLRAQARAVGLGATAERAMAIVHALGGGGRLKASQVARVCCESGGPVRLTGESYGVYIEQGLLEGVPYNARRVQVMAGAEGKVSNHAAVARAGFLGQRLTQAIASGTCVLEEDCGVTPKRVEITTDVLRKAGERAGVTGWRLADGGPIITEAGEKIENGTTLGTRALTAMAENPKITRVTLENTAPEKSEDLHLCVGATLAKSARVGSSETWEAGRTLSADDVEKARRLGAALTVRDLSTCGTEGGVCAKCVGSLESRGREPEVGTEIGVTAASSVNESICQSELSSFHLAQLVKEHDVGKRAVCDAVIGGLSNQRWRTGEEQKKFNAKDPANGSISEEAARGREEQGERGARRRLAQAFVNVTAEGGVKGIDPTLIRVLAHGLCLDSQTDLDRAAARASGRRYAASGLRPKRAARVMADPAAARWETPKERSARIERARERAPEYTNDAHRAAARDDVKTLRRMAKENPEALRREDHLGRTPLHAAWSLEAAQLLMEAGCKPNAPAQWDARGSATAGEGAWRPSALELMTVKTISARGMREMEAAERRRTMLKAMLSHMRGPDARKKVESDPVLRRALSPLGPQARTRKKERANRGNVVALRAGAER